MSLPWELLQLIDLEAQFLRGQPFITLTNGKILSEYCLFDNLRVVLEQVHDSVQKHFDAELLPFGENKKGTRNTITFKEVETLPKSNNVAGSEKRASLKFVNSAPKFELADERMYAKAYQGGRAAIPLKQTKNVIIEYEKDTSPSFLFNTIFPPLLRRHLPTENKTLLHASSAVLNEKAFVYCGWSHSGKTNGLLKCLEKGGKYLGDDKVIMDIDGKIHPYPLRINLFGYNFDANPWLIKRAYSPMRFKWLNWWNKRANNALEKPWNKGPLRGSWESVAYLTKTRLHSRYRPEELSIPCATKPTDVEEFKVLMNSENVNLKKMAYRLRSVNDDEDYYYKKMKAAVDFLYGPSNIYNNGKTEEEIIEKGLSKCKKVIIGR